MQVIYSPYFAQRIQFFPPEEINQLITAVDEKSRITPIYQDDFICQRKFLDYFTQESTEVKQSYLRPTLSNPIKISTPQNSYFLIGAQQKSRFSSRITVYLMGIQKKHHKF